MKIFASGPVAYLAHLHSLVAEFATVAEAANIEDQPSQIQWLIEPQDLPGIELDVRELPSLGSAPMIMALLLCQLRLALPKPATVAVEAAGHRLEWSPQSDPTILIEALKEHLAAIRRLKECAIDFSCFEDAAHLRDAEKRAVRCRVELTRR
jgi:hypothetical protein